MTSPTIIIAVPPATSSTADSANGLAGTGSRVLATEPTDQPSAASSTSHGAQPADPCAPATGPPSSSRASPASPIVTPTRVIAGGRSPSNLRSTTTYSGTEAISNAA